MATLCNAGRCCGGCRLQPDCACHMDAEKDGIESLRHWPTSVKLMACSLIELQRHVDDGSANRPLPSVTPATLEAFVSGALVAPLTRFSIKTRSGGWRGAYSDESYRHGNTGPSPLESRCSGDNGPAVAT